MVTPPRNNTAKKGTLHPRNPHAGRYDFAALCRSCPELTRYLQPNPAGDQTIDFGNSQAIRCLNQALLAHYYQVQHWQIPEGYLCPPIPGRADYIHYLADLLAIRHGGKPPTGKNVKVIDVGTGANCIYPIIGSQSYGWTFLGTDIDPVSIQAARAIVQANPCLAKLVKVEQQDVPTFMFRGIIRKGDHYDLTMCNPPFHASMEEAQASSQRRSRTLGKGAAGKVPVGSNFGGQHAEVSCPGGEVKFVTRMMRESAGYASRVDWFTCLVSKSENLRLLTSVLAEVEAKDVKVIEMSQGQKKSRIMAWTFRAQP